MTLYLRQEPWWCKCRTLEALQDLDAVPLHQRAAPGAPPQESRPPTGRNNCGHLQYGLSRLWCLLLGLHAGVPQRLPGRGYQPTSCSGTQFQAWTGNVYNWKKHHNVFLITWNWSRGLYPDWKRKKLETLVTLDQILRWLHQLLNAFFLLQDLPSFTQSVHRLVNDLRYYRLCNSSLPTGTIKL